jgi:hypothetical protein
MSTATEFFKHKNVGGMLVQNFRTCLHSHIVLQPRKLQNKAPHYAVSPSSSDFLSESDRPIQINVPQLGQYISHVLHAIAKLDMHRVPDRKTLNFHFSLLLTQHNP